MKKRLLDMPNGGKNANPIETIDTTKQSAEKPTVLFPVRDVGGDKYGAIY